MRLSVIIPTFNRAGFLRRTLETVAAQSLDPNEFEVLVVDDGSTDATPDVCNQPYVFKLRRIHQSNQGDAQARNAGVDDSQADILAFLDDDMLLHPEYLSEIVASHSGGHERIVVGESILWTEDSPPPWRESIPPELKSSNKELRPISFTDVCSNNMSLLRETYLAIGQMSALNFQGSSIWCDVEFAYRAHQRGVEFVRNPKALCWHRDHVSKSFEAQKKRMGEAGFRAAQLFRKHPALAHHLPMFEDKVSIDWAKDSIPLVFRKLARRVASTPFMLGLFEGANDLARGASANRLSRSLSRWVLGGCLYAGFRDGIRALQSEPEGESDSRARRSREA
jgi:glycosyltransferase involved in cell wall biosynthesis